METLDGTKILEHKKNLKKLSNIFELFVVLLLSFFFWNEAVQIVKSETEKTKKIKNTDT